MEYFFFTFKNREIVGGEDSNNELMGMFKLNR